MDNLNISTALPANPNKLLQGYAHLFTVTNSNTVHKNKGSAYLSLLLNMTVENDMNNKIFYILVLISLIDGVLWVARHWI